MKSLVRPELPTASVGSSQAPNRRPGQLCTFCNRPESTQKRGSAVQTTGATSTSIAEAAQQLRCDHIVIGTARKNSLIRTIEGSVTNEVIELTTVPVVAIAGDPASKVVRYGIPAGVGGGLAWLVVAAAN